MKKKEKLKKTSKLKKVGRVFSVIITVLVAIFLVNVVVARARGDVPRVFNYSFHLVVTDSMTPEINVGDLVVAKEIAFSDVKVGDDVIFQSEDPSLNKMIIIHRVLEINEDGSLKTTGIKEGAVPDTYPVGEIKGIYVSKSAFLGKIATFFINPINIMFFIIVLVLLYVAYRFVLNIVKTAKKKQGEQAAESESGETASGDTVKDDAVNDDTIKDDAVKDPPDKTKK